VTSYRPIRYYMNHVIGDTRRVHVVPSGEGDTAVAPFWDDPPRRSAREGCGQSLCPAWLRPKVGPRDSIKSSHNQIQACYLVHLSSSRSSTSRQRARKLVRWAPPLNQFSRELKENSQSTQEAGCRDKYWHCIVYHIDCN
jgi:hypothetical protein